MKFRVTLSLAFCGDLDGFEDRGVVSEDEDEGGAGGAAACGDLSCVCRLRLPPLAAVEARVRQIPAAEFVRYVADSVSAAAWAGGARWVDGRFAVEFEVESALSAADLAGELKLYDLEDGEYEAASDNGWTIQCDGRELGTTDFRQLPILVEPIS
jgi:hypothetical protein